MTEEMLHGLFRQLPAACAIHRLIPGGGKRLSSLIFVEGNSIFEKMAGRKMGELGGKHVEEIFQEDTVWMEVYRKALQRLEKGEGEFRAEIQGYWCRVIAFTLDEGYFVLFLYDVSHELRSLEELARQKKKIEDISADLNIIFNSTQDAMFLVACEGDKFVYLRNNRTHQEQTGYRLEEIQGKTPKEVMDVETAETVLESYRRCVETGTNITIEERLDFRGGRRDWLLNLVPVRENGTIRYLVGSRTDITEIKRLRKDREMLLKRLESMFSGHSVAMILVDPETGRILNANPSACKFYGYSSEELLSMYIQEINVMSGEKAEAIIREAGIRRGNFMLPQRLKSGEIRMVDVFSCSINYDGRCEIFSIINDVTDRENYRRAIQEEKELLNVTLRSIGDGVVTTDNGGFVTSMNKAAVEITGWSEEEARGRAFLTLFS